MAKVDKKTSPVKETGEVPQITPEQVVKLQSDLEAANATIQEKEELLANANESLEVANATIQEKEELLTKANESLEAANATIQEKEELLAKANEPTKKSEKAVTSKKSIRPQLLFSHNDKRYTFSRKAPQNINVDGTVYAQEVLIKNKELMVSLIVGNSPFVKNV